jgi:hypothetical protein
MALCRCLDIHAWPEGRIAAYVAYALPVGYPDTSSICGRCYEPGVIWLTKEEKKQYQAGTRIFAGPNNFVRMRADDGGLHEK